MRAHLVPTLLATALLAACTTASPTPSASAPASSSTEPASTTECPTISLRTPSGATLNLTGRWRSPDGGTYYLRQSASCIWFTGLSADTPAPGEEDVSSWTNAFFGYLASDFTFAGSWADTPWGRSAGVGRLSWQIIFDQVDGQEATTLEVTDATGGFGGTWLVRPESVNLQVQLRDSTDCTSVMGDDGTIYELFGLPPGWAATDTPRLIGPGMAPIAVGDRFTVSGDVARGSEGCGAYRLLFADAFSPAVP